jgi:DNA polymerase-1
MGDSSDNIPGVWGIGEKTATTLLQQYGDLDNLYEHIDEIKGATQKKLIEGKDSAYLSRELARIRRDVPVTLHLSDCVAHEFNPDTVLELFREVEFRSLSERLQQLKRSEQLPLFGPDQAELAKPEEVVKTVIVRDEAGLHDLVNTLNNAKAIVWDVETTSTDQMMAELVGIALAVDSGTGFYVPVGHQNGEQLPLQTVIGALRGPLTNPKIEKQAHNAGYDLVVMQRYGIDVSPITFDTMVAEWMRDTTSKFLGLKAFANQYLKVHMTEITELIGTGKKQITMDAVPIEQAAPYAAADAAITYRAVEYLRPELVQYPQVKKLFDELEMPLIPVIAAMEQNGVVLDIPYLAKLSEELTHELNKLEQEIYDLSGGYGKFNINSPKQLNDVLFDKLGLSVQGIKKTQHGYSTDAATLDNLKGQHEIVDKILNYRELSKLKGTYVDALPVLVNPRTGRVHTNYNQTGSSTGRFSSSNPNLQNIPIRTELGRRVRRAFIAPQGTRLLSVDYSQVELRILAHISHDKTLLEAFAQNQDIHKATAATVYGIPLEAVTYEQRNFAKRVNFGLIYGMGAFRLARESNLTLAEAQAFIDTYFNRLPGVRRYLDETLKFVHEHGYVETLLGRRGDFKILKSSLNQQTRQGWERAAINMPIQGTAADIIKKAMIELHHELRRRKLRAKMVLQVHDELVLEAPENAIPETRDLVEQVMEGAYPLDAPLRANAEVGENWCDMEPV